jgi:hypothetical protein
MIRVIRENPRPVEMSPGLRAQGSGLRAQGSGLRAQGKMRAIAAISSPRCFLPSPRLVRLHGYIVDTT